MKFASVCLIVFVEELGGECISVSKRMLKILSKDKCSAENYPWENFGKVFRLEYKIMPSVLFII